MIDELRKVPPRVAVAVIVGTAILTALVLTIVDTASGPKRAGTSRPRADVVGLDGLPTPRGRAPRPATAPRRSSVPLARLVGRRLVVHMPGITPSPAFLDRVRAGLVGGVILFPDNIGSAAQLRSSIDRLQSAARAGGEPGIIVAIDQEGGIVKRLPSAPPDLSAPQIGARDSASLAESEGRATGASLRRLGINVDLAPVLDVPSVSGAFIASRSFGSDPSRVAKLGTAFASGIGAAGVGATAKHFPGLGSAGRNTDVATSVVQASSTALTRQLKPFRRAVAAGIPLVMLSTAIYPAYDSGTPAAFSHRIVKDLLRGQLGFQGLTITDDLQSPAVSSAAPGGKGAVSAAAAGEDLLVFAASPTDGSSAFGPLLAAARSGQLDRGELQASYDRINEFLSGSNR